MGKIAFTQTWNGLTNQPPVRLQPGQVKDIGNLRLALDKGCTTRNGTDFVAWLTQISSGFDINDMYFVSFRGDIIAFSDQNIQGWSGETGAPLNIIDNTNAYQYLVDMDKEDHRHTFFRDSIIHVNRNIVTELATTANYAVAGTVDRFSDLPESAVLGSTYKCRFNDGAVPSGYYSRYNVGSGVLGWFFRAPPNVPNGAWLNTTMPHQLTRNTDGSYTWDKILWTARKSGNEDTNPPPSWVGQPILDVAFHSNRIFLLGKTSITATSTRDHKLLFVYDIDAADDVSNPILMDIAHQEVGEPLYSHSVGTCLFIDCTQGQLVFTSGQEQLTNVNGNDYVVSSLKGVPVIPAFSAASAIILDRFNAVQEYVYDPQSLNVVHSGDLNSHALKILNGFDVSQIYRFDTTTFITTATKTFVHEKGVDQGNLVQTGWTKFDFNIQSSTDLVIFYMDEWDDKIRIIAKHATLGFVLLHYSHKDELVPNNFNAVPKLDFRQYVTGTYIQLTDRTRFVYAHANPDTRVFTPGTQNRQLIPVTYTATYLEVKGHITGSCAIGHLIYNFEDLQKFYYGASTVRPIMSQCTVFFTDSIAFDLLTNVEGTFGGSTQKEYQYKTSELGFTQISKSNIRTGFKQFNILRDGRHVEIRIENKNAVGMTISALEFDISASDQGTK